MKKSKLSIIIIAMVALIFGIIAYYILTVSKTKYAVVPAKNIEAGTTISEDMLKTIEVADSTPGDFINQTQTIIGQKTKNSVSADQLLYTSDFMSGWRDYQDSDDIPEDYTITSITIEDEKAAGGIITPGDHIDVYAVTKDNNITSSRWTGETAEVEEGRSTIGNGLSKVTYVLSNALVLNSTSSLSTAQESDTSVSGKEGDSGVSGGSYVIALSYDDLKKLREIEGTEGVELWANICPAQNQEAQVDENGKELKDKDGKTIYNDPLINQMQGGSKSFLHDAQDAVQDKDGKMIVKEYYKGEQGNTPQ